MLYLLLTHSMPSFSFSHSRPIIMCLCVCPHTASARVSLSPHVLLPLKQFAAGNSSPLLLLSPSSFCSALLSVVCPHTTTAVAVAALLLLASRSSATVTSLVSLSLPDFDHCAASMHESVCTFVDMHATNGSVSLCTSTSTSVKSGKN